MAETQAKQARLAAYTLTEMLVVLVIIGLLAAIVGPRLFSRLDDAKMRTARLQMTSLQTSLDLFRIDLGRLPSAEEGLRVLVEAPAGEPNWLGPYLARDTLPADPWGNAYAFSSDAEGPRIVCYGADGREGGEGADADLNVAISGVAATSTSTAETGAVGAAASASPPPN